MRVSEWNRVIKYAKDACERTPVKFETYKMYDGTMGIYLSLYDSEGNLFKRYASGVHETFEDYKRNIDYYLDRMMATY